MNSSKLNFEYDVRIPDALVQQMLDGEITCAMMITMVILYKWANWKTGRVRWVSSGGLRTASHKQYSDRTFRVSLQKLEGMGWITRHMTPGSHKDYPVTIHNYKFVDDAGKVHILNPKDIKVYDLFENAACREGSHETSYEASQETSHEGSQKDLLNHEFELLHEHKSSNESEPLRKERKKEEAPVASLPTPVFLPESYTLSLHSKEETRHSEEATAVMLKWAVLASHGFSDKDWDAAERLVKQHRSEHVIEVMVNTLTERPKSAAMPWRDFWVFAENFDLNRDLFHAWQRGTEAKARAKAPAPGGKPWVGYRCTVCEIRHTHNKSRICDDCQKAMPFCEACKSHHNDAMFCVADV